MADDATEKEGALEGAPPKLPACETCGAIRDDIENMTEPQLLDAIHMGVLRTLARTLQSGEAPYQELAIARGLLRDNRKVVPPGDNPDGNLPPQGQRPLPSHREFPPYKHDD